MNLRWFLSSKVRQTGDLCAHVRKLRNAQCDLLSPQALLALDTALQNTKAALEANAGDEALAKSAEALEKAANQWLKPYPNAEFRENIEVFLVAIVVAMAIRTFFLQPFKIPTGSMQPTLFGVTVEPLYDPAFQMPGLLTRIYDLAVQGAIYHEAIAPQDGSVVNIGPLEHFLRYFNKQTIWVQYQDGRKVPLTFWFVPDERSQEYSAQLFEQQIGLATHSSFRKGEPIVRFAETTGDHLFVDRFTYNFRRPGRGEIVVFQTKGIPTLDQDQFYIKRLIGLPGETVSIGTNNHARINGKQLDDSSSPPHFRNVYGYDPTQLPGGGFDPNQTPVESHYHGHVLDQRSTLAHESDTLVIRDKHYAVFGDNTLNSLDSRYWGDFPQENVIGKAWFVYWPITSKAPRSDRFGWGQR
jgi:signal peptidase I